MPFILNVELEELEFIKKPSIKEVQMALGGKVSFANCEKVTLAYNAERTRRINDRATNIAGFDIFGTVIVFQKNEL